MSESPPQSPVVPALEELASRRARLRGAKRGASMLLAAAAVILVAARLYPEPSSLAAFIRAAAEAAIVGGLADWFAVTALFRRPLGLPIPHTALIPARKDEIGRALGTFVGEQFLAPELLIARLRRRNRALQVARWLETSEAAEFLGARVATLVPLMMTGTADRDLRAFSARIAQEGLQRIDLAATFDAIVDSVVRGGKHLTIADGAIALLIPALGELQSPLIARISERTGRLFPRSLDRKLGEEFIQGLAAWLDAARTPGSEERARLDAWLTASIAKARSAPDTPAMIARAQAALVAHPALRESLGAIWDEVKRELLADAAAPAPKMASLTRQLVRTVGRLIQDSPAIQQHFNAALESSIVSSIAPWRRDIGKYIADIVMGWDGKAVAEIIELQVGRDLQYIRVNGTLAGAIIGSALFLIGNAIPWLRQVLEW